MSHRLHREDGSPIANQYIEELDVAIELAREAGAIVRTFYEVPLAVHWKDPTEPVTEADRAVNAYLVRKLHHLFPNDGVLAEESKDDLSRLDKQRVWILDPLDGTAEFISHNGEFCIMIGLAVDGVPVVGVVYQPVDEVLYAAASHSGASVERYGDRKPLLVPQQADRSHLRAVISRSHRVALVTEISKRLGVWREQSLGSVGLKIGAIAEGQADLYVHPNAGTREWDTCAPEIILREAGGRMTDCWDRKLRYNERDVARRFGLLASCGLEHDWLSEVVAQVLDEAGVDPDFGF